MITLRAGMVLGSGSTSFEVLGQLGGRLPVTVVPDWMESRVEPIAVVDLVAAVLGAAVADTPTDSFDVGCGQSLRYPSCSAATGRSPACRALRSPSPDCRAR